MFLFLLSLFGFCLSCAAEFSDKRIDLTLKHEFLEGRKITFIKKEKDCYIAQTCRGDNTYSYYCYRQKCERHLVKGNTITFCGISNKYYGELKILFEKFYNN